jgi:hypothetical protein
MYYKIICFGMGNCAGALTWRESNGTIVLKVAACAILVSVAIPIVAAATMAATAKATSIFIPTDNH